MTNPPFQVFTLALGRQGISLRTPRLQVCLFVCLFFCVFVCLFVFACLFVFLFVCVCEKSASTGPHRLRNAGHVSDDPWLFASLPAIAF
jgi:threonine/homoserine/homoserine lactone efflux protein